MEEEGGEGGNSGNAEGGGRLGLAGGGIMVGGLDLTEGG